MSDPHSRLGEARKQIGLAAEDIERLSTLEDADEAQDIDEGVVETLEEAAQLIAEVQAELLGEVDVDDALTDQ